MEHSNSQPSRDPGSLLYMMQEGLIILDSTGFIVFAYEIVSQLFGLDHSQLIGKHFSELY